MSLRSKIILAIVVTSFLIVGTACWIVSQISLSSFRNLEKRLVEQNVQRVEESLNAEIRDLEKAILSYSWWEDTQAFVKQEDPAFADTLVSIFDELPIQTLILSDLQGQIQYVSQNNSEMVTSALVGELSPYLQGSTTDDMVVVHLMTLQEQPAFVVVAPILNNNGQTPSAGRMVAVRYLDQTFIDELSQQTQLSLSYALPTVLKLKPEEEKSLQQHPMFVRKAADTLQSFIPIRDEAGNISFVVGIHLTREIYRQGFRTLKYLLLTLILATLASLAVIYSLIYRIVLLPLKQISQGVRRISLSDEVQLLDWKSHDELGHLTQDINQMLGVIRDNQETIKHSNQALEHSNKELEQFAYVASHDLQEPLRKIQTFGERLSKKYSHALDDDGKLYIERMQDASGRMRVLIQDLLNYSRVKSAGKELVPVDLNEIVRGVVSDLEVRLEQSGGRVEVDILPTVQADPLQMRQIFQNLIGNALKFKNPDVAPVVKVSSVEVSDGLFEITVADNGIGFNNKYAEKVFEVFQRLHGRSEYEGTGMGLAIVRKIIERHKGTIRAESEEGKGTRFILRLPGVQDKFNMKSTFVKELV